jgi:formiminoglutamase
MLENLLPAQLQRKVGNPEGYLMIPNWIAPWDFQEPIDVGLIGAPCNLGAPFWLGTHEAPSAIREAFALFATRSFDFNVDVRDLRVRDLGDIRVHLTDIARTHANIEDTLYELYRRNPDFVPIVLGGDHSVAAPSARAYQRAHEERLGLIDFDAHNDLRDPADEGPSSGTPFRQLIDGGFISGKNAVQVGLHGFLSSQLLREYADGKGLRMVSAREVRRGGIDRIMDEALEQATSQTDGVYVSLDIDVMDPAYAQGTGSPCSGGLEPGEIFEAVYRLGACPQVRALDLVEVDPLRDVKAATSQLAVITIMSFLAGVHARKHGGPSSPPAGLVSLEGRIVV